jgi:ferrochelatase
VWVLACPGIAGLIGAGSPPVDENRSLVTDSESGQTSDLIGFRNGVEVATEHDRQTRCCVSLELCHGGNERLKLNLSGARVVIAPLQMRCRRHLRAVRSLDDGEDRAAMRRCAVSGRKYERGRCDDWPTAQDGVAESIWLAIRAPRPRQVSSGCRCQHLGLVAILVVAPDFLEQRNIGVDCLQFGCNARLSFGPRSETPPKVPRHDPHQRRVWPKSGAAGVTSETNPGFTCSVTASGPQRYDALLVLSFGGPETPDDVMPFLRNVTQGRNVPDERLAIVAEQYALFGGRSPINDHNKALIKALEAELKEHDIDLPIYWGNRNWEPYVSDVVGQMAADGVQRALVYATSAFGSFSACRQYRQDLERARATVGADAPELEKLRLFYNHPGFLQPVADHLAAALAGHTVGPDTRHRIVFTAHSLPQSMAAACQYTEQLTESATTVMELIGSSAANVAGWDLVYQSRSGPPQVPWLEPDICDHLALLAADGVSDVTVVPLGFVSDHMEVLFDLDTQAAAKAAELGLVFSRAGTVGDDPVFVSMIRQLIQERIYAAPRLFLGASGPWPDLCPDNHCITQGVAQRPVTRSS